MVDRFARFDFTSNRTRVVNIEREQSAVRITSYNVCYTKLLRVFAYTRSLDEQRCLVLINFSREVIDYELPEGMTIAATLLDNGATLAPVEAGASGVRLQPWQATLYAL